MKKFGIIGALLTGAVLLALAGPAVAGVFHQGDPAGDVAYQGALESDNPVIVPGRTIGDIRGTNVIYSGLTLHVAAYFRALPSAGIRNVYRLRLKTPEVARQLTIVAVDGRWRGSASFLDAAGHKASCPGLKYVIEYSHRRLVVDVPRACLSNPTFARVGVGTYFTGPRGTFFDDAYSTGTPDAFTTGITLGQAVYRGAQPSGQL